ncbi:MAG: alpha/beta hydrolase [Pirellulaceae bacterium]|nr:alpha/beta hydrolase [Pirellulaceae bacterium]
MKSVLPNSTGSIVSATSVHLHVDEAGQGDPVVLLHGFPEFSYCWRHQMPALAAAGFRAVAPDLRGYNLSDRPLGVGNYRANYLVEDIAALIRNLANGKAHVVGHDWGGVLAWRLAAKHPELVEKLAVLNAPHPAAYLRTVKRNPAQWLQSWYVLFFQLPWLPERLIRSRDFATLESVWKKDPVTPGAYSEEDIARYKEALRPPGALTAGINYYRAAVRWPGDLYGEPQAVRAPTLLIWGEKDRYLGLDLTEGLEAWVPDLRLERIPEASHWVQNDVPEVVNRLLTQFLA